SSSTSATRTTPSSSNRRWTPSRSSAATATTPWTSASSSAAPSAASRPPSVWTARPAPMPCASTTRPATARTYTVTASKATPTGASDVNYAGLERLTATAGDQGDTFTVRSIAAGTTTVLSAGGGFDTFNVGSVANTLDDVKGPLSLIGGSNSVSGLNGII